MIAALIVAALAAVGVTGLALGWQPVPHIRAMWRWWSVRIQAASAMIAGWLAFDPTAFLTALNLMPPHIRAQLPQGVNDALSVAFVLIFAINLLTIVARGIDQPKSREPGLGK